MLPEDCLNRLAACRIVSLAQLERTPALRLKEAGVNPLAVAAALAQKGLKLYPS